MSPSLAPHAPRGVTLLELLVALAVSAVLLLGATALMVSQQRAYTITAGDRAEQEAGRMALREITRRLKTAGYGVDPNLTFDFGAMAGVPRSNLVEPATAVSFAGYLCDTAVRCRDSTTSAASDELVFLSRDPLFSRVASAVTTTTLTLLGELKQPMYAGQILQVSCMGGTRTRAYVTVQSDVAAPAAPDATRPVTVQLLGGVASGAVQQFARENASLADTCFSLATAGQQPVVTAVDRYRFYVAWYDRTGAVVAPQTANARPYLMLDRGLGGAAVNPVPIAADVEDLQVAYSFPPPAAGGGQQLVGATISGGTVVAGSLIGGTGTNIADEAFPVTVTPAAPAYEDEPDAASRLTGHPANITAVRVSVVVRPGSEDATLTSTTDRTVPAAGNRPSFLGGAGWRRTLFETAVPIRNLKAAAFVYPTVNPAGGPGYNLGGG